MKRALLAALLLGAAAAIPAVAAVNPAANPLSRDNLPWWHARHEEKLARVHQGHVDLVFLGDSIFQKWELHGPPAVQDYAPVWEHFYGDRNAVNLGFVGDTTASLLWRILHGEVDGIQPKVAVMLIGANNMGRVHWSAEQTLGGIAAVMDAVHRKLPNTHVILLSELPSLRSAWVDETTREINRGLAATYSHAPGVTYIDVTGLFYKDGQLDKSAFLDGYLTPPEPLLHPNAQTMARIAAVIEPTVARLLGDKAKSP